MRNAGKMARELGIGDANNHSGHAAMLQREVADMTMIYDNVRDALRRWKRMRDATLNGRETCRLNESVPTLQEHR